MAQPDSSLGISVDFPEADFRAGITFAMQMGKNPDEDRQVIFIVRHMTATYWKNGTQLGSTPRLDRDGNPFDPDVEVRTAADTEVRVDCAVEVTESADRPDSGVGIFRPTKLTITLLDDQYALVKDCRELDYNGDRFIYSHEPESDGLFGVGVYQLVYNAKDET